MYPLHSVDIVVSLVANNYSLLCRKFCTDFKCICNYKQLIHEVRMYVSIIVFVGS